MRILIRVTTVLFLLVALAVVFGNREELAQAVPYAPEIALVVIAAAALLARIPRSLAWPGLALALAVTAFGGLVALRVGYHLPVAAPLATLVVASLVGRRLPAGAPAVPGT